MTRLNVGIDVSQDTLDVAFWEQDESVFQGEFPNNKGGFCTIAQKIESKCQETEATSVIITKLGSFPADTGEGPARS